MVIFQLVIGLLFVGALLSIGARASLPYPALPALAGAAPAPFPNVPSVVLDPDLALALFVGPVLLDPGVRLRPGDEAEPEGRVNGAAALQPLQRALAAEHRALAELRVSGVIGDAAFHQVEEELDWADLNADALAR